MHTTSIVNQRISFPTPLSSERIRNGRGRASPSVLAMRSDGEREKRRDYKLVDENMVVLKMRIQEMEMKERENIEIPHKREKEHWFENYDSDVYELVGLLQILMMNNRPSLVLGVVAFLVFASSTSLVVLFSYLLGISM